MSAASVQALASRPARGAGPGAATTLRLRAGFGIDGDIHADASSPRQLLLASASVYEDFALPPHALGENLLLDLDTANLTSGAVLQIGAEVRLRLMFQCEACGQLDRIQPRLAQRLGRRRGMLARVLTAGTVHAGDAVRDLGLLAPGWSDDWRERVRRVLDAMPPGHVVDYRVLARLAGVQSTYCRAMPSLLKRFGAPFTALAVAAQTPSTLPRWDGQGLFDQA